MAAPASSAGNRPPDPPDSPRTRKKFFADIVLGVNGPNQPSISLKKPQTYRGKPAIGISKSEISQLAFEYKYALIGKFSHGRPSMNIVRKSIASIGLKGAYTLGSIDARHLLINLRLEEDYARMWLKVTWLLDGYPMRLLKWTPNFHPMRETPIAPVWITMPFLPVHLFNKNILYSIANLVGKPLKVDEPTANVTRPSLARVCVELDLTKPLVESVWVSETLDEAPDEIRSEGFHQNIEYEYVPPYCKHCCHVGHDVASCYSGKTVLAHPRTQERQEHRTTKGKEVMVEVKGQSKKQSVDYGFMKDARKGDNLELRVWLDKKRNKANLTTELDITREQNAESEKIVNDVGEASKVNDVEQPVGNDQEGNKNTELEDGQFDTSEEHNELACVDEQNAIESLEEQEQQGEQGITNDGMVEKEGSVPVSDVYVELAVISPTVHPQTHSRRRSTGGEEETLLLCNEPHEQQELEAECEPLAQQTIDDNIDYEVARNLLDGDLENDFSALDNLDEFSKDDSNIGSNVAEPSFHPHTHSRRKSDGDVAEGLEGMLENEAQQNDNLRRSTRTKKLTFKVRKSPTRG